MWILRPFRLTTEKGDSCGMNLDNPISWWTYLQVILHPLPSHPTPQTQQKENGTKKKKKQQKARESTKVLEFLTMKFRRETYAFICPKPMIITRTGTGSNHFFLTRTDRFIKIIEFCETKSRN